MWGGDSLPYAIRFANYTNMLLMTNVTTPLFPVLAWMKHRKIQSIKASSQVGTKQKAS